MKEFHEGLSKFGSKYNSGSGNRRRNLIGPLVRRA